MSSTQVASHTYNFLDSFSQALAGSDVGILSFGSPINTSALFIILLHQVIESNTLVRTSLIKTPHSSPRWLCRNVSADCGLNRVLFVCCRRGFTCWCCCSVQSCILASCWSTVPSAWFAATPPTCSGLKQSRCPSLSSTSSVLSLPSSLCYQGTELPDVLNITSWANELHGSTSSFKLWAKNKAAQWLTTC